MNTTIALLAALASAAGLLHAGDKTPAGKEVKRTQTESWEYRLAVPAWLAGSRGDTGLNGTTAYSNTGFDEIVNKIDMAGSLRGEAGRGKFGAYFDFSYFSMSDGVGLDGAAKKIDVQLDEILGDLGVRWRLIDGPRGYLDAIGGTRYTYMYEQVALQGDDQAISALADRLAIAGTLLRARLAQGLKDLDGRDRQRFSGPSLTADEQRRLARELVRIRGNVAERSARIEKALTRSLNGRFSRTDQWFDPYFGFRGRYDFNDRLYFTGRADISPFDVGADFAWQASAGFGWELSSNKYLEVVYRVLHVDYRHDGLTYNTTSHGPEITLGIKF